MKEMSRDGNEKNNKRALKANQIVIKRMRVKIYRNTN
jgi:hypothetical protein